MSQLSIDSTTIKTDSAGLFCLNDLHKAAGGDPKHQPAKFFANQSTRALVQELRNSPNLETFLETHTGRNGGTYVCKELVYAYAMWISPAFHLKVIRTFDNLQTQGVAVADHAVEDLLNDPLSYLDRLMAQAKKLKAERDAAKAALEVAEPKALVFDHVVADKQMSVSRFARTLPGVNLNRIKRSLFDLGYFYKKDQHYRVYAKHRAHFEERVQPEYGTWEIFPTASGKVLLTQLHREGKLIMRGS